VIDVFVVPRLPVTVCHLVTPLKPYEAFALERAVVLSDVTALAGIAAESGSAMLAKAGSARSLARTIGRALDNDEMRLAMARRARQWVIENRTWEGNARLYEDLYGALSKSRHAPVPSEQNS
jgi:glycosyltransferase involved in cell wall biosynthesis